MRLLDLTLPSGEENLAIDEALLDEVEDHGVPLETLRLWEPAAPMIVVGRSSHVDREVRREKCRELGIPILRRASGGAAVVTGPGCLMYAVVLSLQLRPALRAIDVAHRFVLGTIVAALRRQGFDVAQRGTSDLTLSDRKFSGNSLRVRRDYLLYHGTLLYDFPLDLIAACLSAPPRQPDYRDGRDHEAFVTNLPVNAGMLRRILVDTWQAEASADEWPLERVAELVAGKYARLEWNYRH